MNENEEQVKSPPILLEKGKCEFFITDISDFDYQGKKLITQKGKDYTNIKLYAIDSTGKGTYVYDTAFNSKRLEQLIKSVDYYPAGQEVNVRKIDYEDFFGCQGDCIIAHTQDKKNGGLRNSVICYIRKQEVAAKVANSTVFEPVQDEEMSDEIPF